MGARSLYTTRLLILYGRATHRMMGCNRAGLRLLVERNGRTVLVLDAKNAEYKAPQYLDQMHWYLTARECQCTVGVLIHSVAPSGTWSRYTRNGSTVIYTHLTPQHGPGTVEEEQRNGRILSRIVDLISEQIS